MALAVHSVGLRVDKGRGAASKYHAGSADGAADGAGPGHTHAHAACLLIACPGGHGDTGPKAPTLRHVRQQASRHVLTFQQPLRHQLTGQARRPEQPVGPLPGGQIQQPCAGGVGYLAGDLAGHFPAQIVLGKQHLADAVKDLRLMPAQPQQLGRPEAGQAVVGGIAHGLLRREPGVQFLRLAAGALIHPDHAGVRHGAITPQQYTALHLAGQADAGDAPPHTGDGHRLTDSPVTGVPPVGGTLLCPAGPGRYHVAFLIAAAADHAGGIHNDGLDAAGSGVDAQ